MAEGPREARFLSALEDLFTGAEVDGDSGFVNLMRMKHQYFQDIRRELMSSIEKRAPQDSSFREELFDKLHTFFAKYFCESGAIYFRHLPAFERTYERVYADGADVALSWKTQNLYYVKSDTLVRSMPVDLPGPGPGHKARFHFDASQIQHKRNNERRDFLFTFQRVENPPGGRVLHLCVTYSEQGRRTKSAEILKAANQAGMRLGEDDLEAAIRKFRRQTEADFFIHKNAGAFLREQFDLWLHQFMFKEQNLFEQNRLIQLQALRDTARDIIAFIAQFEDELRRAWEKPKFARNANYVITLDRLPGNLLEKIAAHPGRKAQVAEWRGLGLVEDGFRMAAICKGQKALKPGATGPVNGAHRFLPLDTKHFKDLELEILGALGDLDAALDGELIHSENWQALNTLRKRYAGRVKCIYIDPPYNTGTDFEYRDQFQNSTWLSMMSNRLDLARDFLSESGYIYLQLDHYADYLGRILLQNVFPQVGINDQTVITWNTGDNISGFKTQRDNWIRQADKIIFFPKNPDTAKFVKLWSPVAAEKDKKIGWLDFIGPDKQNLYIEKWVDGNLSRVPVNVKSKRIGTIWNDVYSFQYSEPRETESFSFQTQKPENLLRRVIQSCTQENDIVLDMYSGTGTTPAVSQKLGRKWIAIESDKHFGNFYTDNGGQKKVGILGRLKIVLSGDKRFTLPNTPEERKPHLSKDLNWEGGGAFQYYTLEQYEETLKNAHYKDSNQLTLDTTKSPFQQYIFINDDKFAHAVQPSQTAPAALEIALHTLYPDISLPQTLANALGKQIRQITPEAITFTDNTTHPLPSPTMPPSQLQTLITTLKPYLWWGE